MFRIRLTFAIASIVVFSSPAFADKVKLTILSDPAGATVYANQWTHEEYGYAPVTLQYEVGRDFFKQNRCVTTHPIKLRWVSGAEATVSPRICGGGGKSQTFVFVRPVEGPGRELDAFCARAAPSGASARGSIKIYVTDGQLHILGRVRVHIHHMPLSAAAFSGRSAPGVVDGDRLGCVESDSNE